jgi:hypothetical protein
MSTSTTRPPRLQNAQRLCQRAIGLRYVMQHEHQRRRIEPPVVDRQRFELAAPEIDVVELLQALLRRLEHRSRPVDRHHARDERRQGGAHRAGPATEIADDPRAVCQGGERREVEAIAEQLVADAIPLPDRRREKLLRLRAPLGERRLKTALILRRRGARTDMFADQQPEPAGRPVQLFSRHRIQVARALGSRADPPGIGQGFQMAADRRLGQLHDAAELGHGQLVPVEQQQDPAAGRIGQRGEVVEDCGGPAIHP